MTRRLPTLLALLGTFTAASLVRADAPTGQYADFRQSTPVILDNNTKLYWERKVITDPILGSTLNLDQAKTACGALGPGKGRLPTMKELLTLVDEVPHDEYENKKVVQKAFDQAAFLGAPVDTPYWTATDSRGEGNYVVNFQSGTTSTRGVNEKMYVRCVYNNPL